jgi:hypothetical protein
MKLFSGRSMRRALSILVFAVGVVGVAADTQIDGALSARSTYGDVIDMRFATGTLLGVTVDWAAGGPCGGAADFDLVICPNRADAVFLQDGRLAAQGDIHGGGTYSMSGEFGSDSASGTLRLTAVTGCPADHTIAWAVGTTTAASPSIGSTAILSMTWGALKMGLTPR